MSGINSSPSTHILRKDMSRTDQNVKKGETVALAGEKDDDGLTYIHFEVRLKGKAHNISAALPAVI